MNDVILNGTTDSMEEMDVFIPRFQIRIDNRNFMIDVINACRNNRFDET
mgnify:CR=1 FL=1